MSASVYLDYNATARPRPQALAAASAAMRIGANPSSVHAAGRAARAAVESARGEIAALVGAHPVAITFTSGGAEANALAIDSAALGPCRRIIVGATEHDTVSQTVSASGLPVEVWPVDGHGRADLDWLAGNLTGAGPALVCLMLANNETGVIQPVAEAAALVAAADGWLHVDAVQAAGKMEIDFADLGADTLTLSGHKLGGPQGTGALVAGPRARLARRLHGGGQESGLRAGTENLPGIAGFGAAAAKSRSGPADLAGHAVWRDGLAARVSDAGAVILGEGAPRLPQTLCFATPGFSSDLQVIALDLAGVMISAGAACSAGKVARSQVVEAMGRGDLAAFSVRVSGGWDSTAEDWRRCGDAWIEAFETWAGRRRKVA